MTMSGEQIPHGSDPIKSTIKFVKRRYPDIPVKIIKLVTKMQFHHRLKCINQLCVSLSAPCPPS